MHYYAHYGHKEFILCLGYRGDLIREYFLNYNEAMSNDFTLSEGGRRIEVHGTDIEDWKITFVDTGLHSNLGQRLMAIKQHLGDDEVFLANYSDGLSDVPLDAMIENFHAKEAVASFVAVRTTQSFHAAKFDADGVVNGLGELGDADFWINGGFFVLRKDIFDYMRDGEELVEEPFSRIIQDKKLVAFPYTGFWQAMDTFKDKINFDRSYARGDVPWQVWKR
jgi:glucose-1-phosphate cytidylyltransferase